MGPRLAAAPFYVNSMKVGGLRVGRRLRRSSFRRTACRLKRRIERSYAKSRQEQWILGVSHRDFVLSPSLLEQINYVVIAMLSRCSASGNRLTLRLIAAYSGIEWKKVGQSGC